MSEQEKITCNACGHQVDENARTCPYCGADPRSGEREPKPPIDEILPGRQRPSFREKVTTFVRSRTGVVLAISIGIGVALLIAVSSWLDERHDRAATNARPIPLTEVTDLAADAAEQEPAPEMPDLDFEYGGDPDAMESFIIEEGAIPPEDAGENEAEAEGAAETNARDQEAAPSS
ncbi:MAG: zinc ribbon domain-containing protein [Thermoanaerobaculia bacterium]|nr:zinc ribbon domain-containing protein [Thermoanaerobaculia bacterium]